MLGSEAGGRPTGDQLAREIFERIKTRVKKTGKSQEMAQENSSVSYRIELYRCDNTFALENEENFRDCLEQLAKKISLEAHKPVFVMGFGDGLRGMIPIDDAQKRFILVITNREAKAVKIEFVNIASIDHREEAVQWLVQHFGARKEKQGIVDLLDDGSGR